MRAQVLACLLAAFALPPLFAAPEEIADGVRFFPGQANADIQPDGNSVLFRGETGWIVFDTGRHAAHTARILDFAANSGRPIVAVVNSHWHLDHVSGNRRIAAAYPGAVLYATDAVEAALKGFLGNYDRHLTNAIERASNETERERLQSERDTIHADEHLLADVVLDGCGERAIDGRRFVVCVVEHAVTSADVWVLDVESGVLAAGDLVTLPVPFLDTACPEGWRDSLRNLLEADFRILVPGHGQPLAASAVERYTVAFGDLLACAASGRSKAQCADTWLGDVDGLLPSSEDSSYARTLLSYYFDNHLRGDTGQQAVLCRGEGV